jgi:hypothetical protein
MFYYQTLEGLLIAQMYPISTLFDFSAKALVASTGLPGLPLMARQDPFGPHKQHKKHKKHKQRKQKTHGLDYRVD